MLRSRRRGFLLASGLVALFGACTNGDRADDSGSDVAPTAPPPHSLLRPGVNALSSTSGKVSGPSSLLDHGGAILPSSLTYAIWWGPAGDFPSDAQTGITNLLSGLDGTAFLATANQYMRGASATTRFITNWADPSSPPAQFPTGPQIVSEVCSVIDAQFALPQPTAIYFVYASNLPAQIPQCGFHAAGTCHGTTIQVAYLPNLTGVTNCTPATFARLYNDCNPLSQGTQALANATSHEFMDAITDPAALTWFDSSGASNGEIADKCAWQFLSCVGLNDGFAWQLQEEWSNDAGGCVQAEPAPWDLDYQAHVLPDKVAAPNAWIKTTSGSGSTKTSISQGQLVVTTPKSQSLDYYRHDGIDSRLAAPELTFEVRSKTTSGAQLVSNTFATGADAYSVFGLQIEPGRVGILNHAPAFYVSVAPGYHVFHVARSVPNQTITVFADGVFLWSGGLGPSSSNGGLPFGQTLDVDYFPSTTSSTDYLAYSVGYFRPSDLGLPAP